MNLLNFGREQAQKGMLNNMLQQVGIDDVGSFVDQFRNEAGREAVSQRSGGGGDEDEDEDSSVRQASGQQANLMSMGSSFLNQVFNKGVFAISRTNPNCFCLVYWWRWRWRC
jgi:hypothetical protein